MQNHSYSNLLVLQQSLDLSLGIPNPYSSYYYPKPNLHSNEKTASNWTLHTNQDICK